jgi:hypothetical protein
MDSRSAEAGWNWWRAVTFIIDVIVNVCVVV